MYTYGNCYGAWWPGSIIGILIQILIAVVIIAVIIRIVRGRRLRDHWDMWPNSAERLLKERFVKGEISKEEYEEKLKVIRN